MNELKQEKTRKTYNGEKNNKQRSEMKLISAVGEVLREKGYTGLTVSNIAKAAGLDRKLIYLYFGTVENLIETYIKQKDLWISAEDHEQKLKETFENSNPTEVLKSNLLHQLNSFLDNIEMQKAVTWQISEKSEIMSKITREREKLSELFFAYADKEYPDNPRDIRAITALIVSGIYYVVLHAKNTDSTVCDIELDPAGFDRIRHAINDIVEWTFSKNKLST